MPRSVPESRPAFDLVEGFTVGSILAGLEMAGFLPALEADGISDATIGELDPEPAALLTASLRYLEQRGVVAQRSGVFTLTDDGRAVCHDKGYLVWLVGGYGEPLRRLDQFLAHGKRYGDDYPRDGRWVANGTALLGRVDVVPQALELLGRISFDRVLDLGCGNARFLLKVCERFGAHGVGIDVSPEACAAAEEAVRAAGMGDRVDVVIGDAGDLATIPSLDSTDLVVTFFLLHEILASGRDRLVRYLDDLSSRLPAGAHLVIAEIEPPAAGGGPEVFTPEFTYVHALMRQRLLPADEWTAVLTEGGFKVREVVPSGIPGGILLLCQTPG